MPLVDHEIIELCRDRNLVQPFDFEQVNPASIDIRAGHTIMIEDQGSILDRINRFLFRFKALRRWVKYKETELVFLDLTGYTKEEPYYFAPKEFFLASSFEIFNLPSNVAAEYRLNSSLARRGINHLLAVWGDPGWQGSVWTLELINERRFGWLPFYPGMRIGQVVFHSCQEPTADYSVTGRYNGDRTVTAEKV